mmetsp:Transcript_18314/g.59246  ORF Transcript_18314/g.59246 Transcript_18314/m.59246 type:complete len:289 (-) Transcript_18314:242-1108(-)
MHSSACMGDRSVQEREVVALGRYAAAAARRGPHGVHDDFSCPLECSLDRCRGRPHGLDKLLPLPLLHAPVLLGMHDRRHHARRRAVERAFHEAVGPVQGGLEVAGTILHKVHHLALNVLGAAEDGLPALLQRACDLGADRGGGARAGLEAPLGLLAHQLHEELDFAAHAPNVLEQQPLLHFGNASICPRHVHGGKGGHADALQDLLHIGLRIFRLKDDIIGFVRRDLAVLCCGLEDGDDRAVARLQGGFRLRAGARKHHANVAIVPPPARTPEGGGGVRSRSEATALA